MATTGRGDYPLSAEWFRRALATNANHTRKPILPGSDGVAAQAVWKDFFFEAAAAGTGPSMIWVLDDDITILRRPA